MVNVHLSSKPLLRIYSVTKFNITLHPTEIYNLSVYNIVMLQQWRSYPPAVAEQSSSRHRNAAVAYGAREPIEERKCFFSYLRYVREEWTLNIFGQG